MDDCQTKFTAELSRLRAKGWIVESSQAGEYLLRKPGRSVLPFRLLSFRGLLWCLATLGFALVVWLSVALGYSWYAKLFPIHRDRTKELRLSDYTERDSSALTT